MNTQPRSGRQDGAGMDDEIRLRYAVGGGIGGRFAEFETDSARLTPAEEEQLRRLIAEADFFDIPNSELGPIITDGYTRRLWISVGGRSHEVVRGDGTEVEDSEALIALMFWADERTPPLFPRLDADLS